MQATFAATSNTVQGAPPPGAMIGIMIFMMAVIGFIFVLLPALWLWFYSGKNVKATCEARNPAPSWTDACPLPVLALSMLAAFSAPMTLIIPFMGHMAFPLFGIFLNGAVKDIFFVIMAALAAYISWALYRLRPAGWWLQLGLWAMYSVSNIVMFSTHDYIYYFRKSGYPQTTIDVLQKNPLITGHYMLWMTFGIMMPLFGYLLFIKRYFRVTPVQVGMSSS
jgi:hypothetical protein